MKNFKLFLSLLMLVCFSVGTAWADEAEVTFTYANTQWTTTAGSQKTTIDGVSISTTNGLKNEKNSDFRSYASAQVTVSSTTVTITKIVFTYSNSYFTEADKGSWDKDSKTWTGSESSITFSQAAQVRMTNVVVTYETVACTNTVTVTPGATENGSFELSATEVCGDGEGGVVTIKNIKPEEGYTIDEITATNGTVDETTNKVTGITDNTTITVTFKALPAYTVSFNTGAGNPTQADIAESAAGAGIELPAGPVPSCSADGWEFAGWAEDAVSTQTTTKPTLLAAGDMYNPTDDVTLFAVYRKIEGEGTTTVRITPSAITGDKDPYTLTHDQAAYTIQINRNGGTTPAVNATNKDARIYAGATMKVECESPMSELIFFISAQGLKRLTTVTPSEGDVAKQASGDETVTWSGNTTSVTFTVGEKADYGTESTKAGQLDFDSIRATASTATIYYLSAPSCCEGFAINVATDIEHGTVTAPSMACAGATVSLTATPDEHCNFVKWDVNTVDGEPIKVDAANTFTMPDPGKAVNVSAEFAEITNYVHIATVSGGTLVVQNAAGAELTDPTSVKEGAELTVTVTPDAANHYIGGEIKVTEYGTDVDITSEVLNGNTLTMPGKEITIAATFTPTYKINIVADGGEVELTYEKGDAEDGYAIPSTQITAVATADATHDFVSIEVSDNANIVSTSGNTLVFIMPVGEVTVTATFAAKTTPTLSVTPAELNFGTVAQNSTPVAQKFKVEGANLKGSQVSLTLDATGDNAFEFSPAVLDITAGTVNAEITVTPKTDAEGNFIDRIIVSADDIKDADVYLSIIVQKLYSAKWYVNGEAIAEATQTAVEGTDLIVPANPTKLSDDCEEMVFMGWVLDPISGKQESAPDFLSFVNAKMPAQDINYYAVFAEKTGETPAEKVVIKHSVQSTENMDGTNQATLFGLDDTQWSVVGQKGDASYNVGLNTTNKDIRLYWAATGGCTFTVAAPKKIDSIRVEFSSGYDKGYVKVGDATIALENGAYPIEGTSFYIGNANANNAQVRFTSVTVIFNGYDLYSNYLTTCPTCNKVTLVAETVSNGSVELSATSVKTCDPAEVKVTATPNTGYELTNVALSGVEGASYSEGKISIPADATGELTVTPTFSAIDYTVTVAQTGGDDSYISPNQDNKHYGETITISANTADGYVFLGWTADPEVTFADASENIATFTMPNSNVTVTANYAKIYTVEEAIALMDQDKSKTYPNTYVSGLINNVEKYYTDDKSIDYWISDDGTTKAFEIYKGKGLNGANFASLADLHVGDKVIAVGTLTYYSNATTYELAKNGTLYQYEAINDAPSSLAISGTAEVTKYAEGETFNPAGLVVTGTYNTGYKKVITEGIEWSTDPATITADGEIKVTAKVGEVTSAEYPVNVQITEKAPEFTPAAGTYTSAQTVTLKAAEGAKIYYTTNGEDPEVKDELLYTEPISLTERGETTIKALAYSAAKGESRIVSAVYNINLPYKSLAELVAAGLESGTKDVIVEFSTTIKSITTNKCGIDLDFRAGSSNNYIRIFCEGKTVPTTWNVGDAISGTITGTWFHYTGSSSSNGIKKAGIDIWEILPNAGFEWTDLTYTKPQPGLEWSAATGTGYEDGRDPIVPTLTNPHEVSVTYESSDTNVANINPSGEITTGDAGTAIITASFAGDDTYAEQSVSYTLTVYDIDRVEVIGDATQKQYQYNEDFNFAGLGAQVVYTNGEAYEINEPINWKATPDQVTSNGSITVDATWGAYISAPKDIENVTVKTHEITFAATGNGSLVVKANGTAITTGDHLLKGDVLTFEATPDNDNYKLATLTANETDIKVAKQYTVGTEDVVIAATFEEKAEAGLAWTANKGTAYSVGKDNTLPDLINNNSLTVTFSSSNTAVAEIDDATGVITLKDKGTATITVSFAGNDDYKAGEASYELTYTKPASVAISGDPNTNYTVNEDFNFDGLKLIVTYDNNDTWEATTGVEWTADPAKMTLGLDKVNVTGKWEGISSSALEVTVTVSDKPAAEISWSASSALAYTIGKEYPALPTLDDKGLTVSYESSETGVATIDADGKVTIVAKGQTVIKATFAGNDAYRKTEKTYVLNVYAPESIAIGGECDETQYDKDAAFSFAGLTATVTYGDATTLDVTAQDIWSTDLTDGKVTAAGDVTVTAKWNGLEDTKVVAVTVKETPLAIDNAEVEMKANKIMINGIIYIQRGDKLFNVQGQVVR